MRDDVGHGELGNARRRALAFMAVVGLMLTGCTTPESPGSADGQVSGSGDVDTATDKPGGAPSTPAESSMTAPSVPESTTAAAGEIPAELADFGIGSPTPALCDGREPLTVGYDVFSDTQDYVISLNESLQTTIDEIGGCVDLVTLVDNADPATAVSNVQTLIQRDVDAVLLFQVVAASQPGIMDLLDEADIPAIAHAVPAPGATLVSPSDVDAGRTAAQALIEGARDADPGATPFVILGEEPDSGAVSDNRVALQAEVIREAYPDLPDDNVVMLGTDGSPDDAFGLASDIAARVPNEGPVLVSGINDDVVGGIYRALDQAGKADNVIAVGMGALFPSGVTNVCQISQFAGTVDFRPDSQGPWIVPALLAAVDGAELPEVINPPVDLLTRDEVPERFPDFEC